MTRFLLELGILAVMAVVAFGIVFSIAWVVGSPFGLEAGNAAFLSGLALCFWFPGFVNVHIAVGANGNEKRQQRISAGIRAFGMLTCSAVLTAPLFASGFSVALGVPLFVFGSVCWWGSFVFDQIRT